MKCDKPMVRDWILKYIGADRMINGLTCDAKDTVTLFFGERKMEIDNYILNQIPVRVNEMMRNFHFWLVSKDGNWLKVMPEWVIENGYKIGYPLAFREIVEKQKVDWTKLLNATN